MGIESWRKLKPRGVWKLDPGKVDLMTGKIWKRSLARSS